MAKRRNIIIRTWDYFRNSWEGDDGKFSYRRFCQYILMGIAINMVASGQAQNQYGFYTLLTILVIWCLITAIITVQQLMMFMRYYTSRDRLIGQIATNDEENSPIDASILANPDGVQRPLEHPLDQIEERKTAQQGGEAINKSKEAGSESV